MGAEEKIKDSLITLPQSTVEPDAFSYAVVSGKTIHVAGILPFDEGGRLYAGRLGADVRTDTAKQAAKSAVLLALSSIKKEIGDLNKIKRICRLELYLNTTPDFKDHRQVSDAASLLIRDLFGAAGKHTQLTTGVASLPKGALCMLSMIAEV